MLQDCRKHKLLTRPLTGRAYSFKTFDNAAFHRVQRAEQMSAVKRYRMFPSIVMESLKEAERHAIKARKWIEHSRPYSHVEVLP